MNFTVTVNKPKKKNIISIDFGTSKSILCYYGSEVKTTTPPQDVDYKFINIPTILKLSSNNNFDLVPSEYELINEKNINHDDIVIRSIKRTLGLNFDDINQDKMLSSFFGSQILNVSKDSHSYPEVYFKLQNNKLISNLNIIKLILEKLKIKAESKFSSQENFSLSVTESIEINKTHAHENYADKTQVNGSNETRKNEKDHEDSLQESSIEFDAVLTAPIYFDEISKAELRFCAERAGFNVMKILPEPVAAIYAHDLNNGVYLVFDLGAGTYDLSLIQMKNSIYRVLGNGGDRYIGGDNIDVEIAQYLLKKYYHHNDLIDREIRYDLTKLTLLGKTIKEHITNTNSDYVNVISAKSYPDNMSTDSDPNEIDAFHFNQTNISDYCVNSLSKPNEVHISVEEFEKIIEGFVDNLISILKNFLDSVKHSHNMSIKIEGIVFAGRSTKIKQIHNRICNMFLNTPVHVLNEPEITVALGALKHINSENKLLQVAPLSLGIEIMGGVVEKIIERNAQLPISVKKIFTNYSEQQTKVKINILEGERDMVEHCKSLGIFEVDIPKSRPGTVRIEVTFSLDFDANLLVTAEVNNEIKQFFRYEPFKNLDVWNEIKKSIDFHHEDMTAKNLAELIVKAKVFLANVKNLINTKGFANLSNNEEFNNLLLNLDKSIDNLDSGSITAYMNAINAKLLHKQISK